MHWHIFCDSNDIQYVSVCKLWIFLWVLKMGDVHMLIFHYICINYIIIIRVSHWFPVTMNIQKLLSRHFQHSCVACAQCNSCWRTHHKESSSYFLMMKKIKFSRVCNQFSNNTYMYIQTLVLANLKMTVIVVP